MVTSPDSICGVPDSAIINVNVIPANPVSLTLSDTAVCRYAYDWLHITGLTDIHMTNVSYNYWLDSSNILLTSFASLNGIAGDDSVIVQGYNSCGQLYTQVIYIPYTGAESTVLDTFSPIAICRGDSSLLSFSGFKGQYCSPSNTASWIDSNHIWLFPDTTTSYLIYGRAESCEGYDYLNYYVRVINADTFFGTSSNQYK